MQNALDFCLTEVVSNIPPQVLEVALRQYNRKFHKTDTLAMFITKAIIHDRVLKHCNLSAGKLKTIPLRAEWIESASRDHGGYAGDDGPFTIFRIPPEFRDNLPISNVISVQYPYNTYLGGGIGDLNVGTGGYNLTDQIDEVLNSYTMSNPRNHPIVKLLDGDLVQLIPSQYAMQNWLLTVRISFNDEFTNLEESAIPTLAKMVVLATKQWCYNNLTIDIDRAVQETGAEIGAFKAVIDEYRDSGQLFEEQIVLWRGCANLDAEIRRRLLAYQL